MVTELNGELPPPIGPGLSSVPEPSAEALNIISSVTSAPDVNVSKFKNPCKLDVNVLWYFIGNKSPDGLTEPKNGIPIDSEFTVT